MIFKNLLTVSFLVFGISLAAPWGSGSFGYYGHRSRWCWRYNYYPQNSQNFNYQVHSYYYNYYNLPAEDGDITIGCNTIKINNKILTKIKIRTT